MSSIATANPDVLPIGTDGNVTAATIAGNTPYIGGAFTWVGPLVGGGIQISTPTKRARPEMPRIAGVVWAVIPDGAGGWFVGGDLVGIGGLPRTCLGHIRRDGSVDSWAPKVQGQPRGTA